MTSILSDLTIDTLWNSLKTHQYVQVPFPIHPPVLDAAIKAFFAFLEEPEDIKNHIKFSISPAHRRGDVGFTHRVLQAEPYEEHKDFFHFHPAVFEKYDDFLQHSPVVHDFLLKALPIWKAAYETVHALLSKLDTKFPGTLAKVFDTQTPHLMIRFLKYHWAQSGKYLAHPHFDAGSFTLAIAESTPGLRIGKDPSSLKPVEHHENQALFFVSSNYQKLFTTEEICPAWHDVIQLDETQIGKPFARWAIVTFIEAAGVEALSKIETHKWNPQAAVS